jgi:hypothetical protein
MIILDIDNVIANDGWRIPLIDTRTTDLFKRYDDYHRASINDESGNRDIWAGTPHGIILLTSRPACYSEITVAWLKEQGVQWECLLMRCNTDYRPAVLVKRDQLRSLPKFGYVLSNIYCAYDDRADIVAMYEAAGVAAARRFIHEVPYPEVVG